MSEEQPARTVHQPGTPGSGEHVRADEFESADTKSAVLPDANDWCCNKGAQSLFRVKAIFHARYYCEIVLNNIEPQHRSVGYPAYPGIRICCRMRLYLRFTSGVDGPFFFRPVQLLWAARRSGAAFKGIPWKNSRPAVTSPLKIFEPTKPMQRACISGAQETGAAATFIKATSNLTQSSGLAPIACQMAIASIPRPSFFLTAQYSATRGPTLFLRAINGPSAG